MFVNNVHINNMVNKYTYLYIFISDTSIYISKYSDIEIPKIRVLMPSNRYLQIY